MVDVHELSDAGFGAGIDTNGRVLLFARPRHEQDVQVIMAFRNAGAAAAALAEWGRMLAPFIDDNEPF